MFYQMRSKSGHIAISWLGLAKIYWTDSITCLDLDAVGAVQLPHHLTVKSLPGHVLLEALRRQISWLSPSACVFWAQVVQLDAAGDWHGPLAAGCQTLLWTAASRSPWHCCPSDALERFAEWQERRAVGPSTWPCWRPELSATCAYPELGLPAPCHEQAGFQHQMITKSGPYCPGQTGHGLYSILAAHHKPDKPQTCFPSCLCCFAEIWSNLVIISQGLVG